MSYAIVFALDKNKVAELREVHNIPAEWLEISQKFDHLFCAFEKYPLEYEWCGFYYTNEYMSGTDGMMVIQALMANVGWLSEAALILSFRPVETKSDVDDIVKHIKSVLAE